MPPVEPEGAEIEDLMPPRVKVSEFDNVDSTEFIKTLEVFEIRLDSISTIGSKRYIRFSDPHAAVRAKAIFDKLNVTRKTISFSVQVVLALEEENKSKGQAIDDPELLDQLKQLFKFKDYRILDSGYKVEQSGGWIWIKLMSHIKEDLHVNVQPIYLEEGNGLIKLKDLQLYTRKGNKHIELLRTSLNVKSRDTVIVGGSKLLGKTYLTIITADVL